MKHADTTTAARGGRCDDAVLLREPPVGGDGDYLP